MRVDHQKKYENNLHIVKTNILLQNRRMQCINGITTFDMTGMFEQSKENYNLKDSNEQKFLNPSHVLAREQ